MAIKGKNRAKSKPRPAARAPKRDPVVVKPPFFQRRWVQVALACVLGAAATLIVIWVTNGLRQNSADAQAAADAATRRAAATAWQQEVEAQISKVGTPQQGRPPLVFPAMNTALDAMKRGTVPPTAADTFGGAADGAAAAVKALSAFDLAGTIEGQGFDVAQALSFTDSKDRLANALILYQRASEVAVLAAKATGAQQTTLTKTADDLRNNAATEFQQAWITYGEALAAGGINNTLPTGATPNLGG
jgi:hypothetical protein